MIIPIEQTEPSNVIGIDPAAQAELEITLAHRARDYCPGWHKRVTVSEHLRALVCNDCGKVIDSFDFVQDWARTGDHKMSGLRGLEARSKIVAAEVTKLEHRLQTLRAALKKIGHPQPEEEKREYYSQMCNAGRERGPHIV